MERELLQGVCDPAPRQFPDKKSPRHIVRLPRGLADHPVDSPQFGRLRRGLVGQLLLRGLDPRRGAATLTRAGERLA